MDYIIFSLVHVLPKLKLLHHTGSDQHYLIFKIYKSDTYFLNIVLSVWVMYCEYCVHEYHSYITFTDGTLSQHSTLSKSLSHQSTWIVLEEQVAVGLYYILTCSCSSKTKLISSVIAFISCSGHLNQQYLLSRFVCLGYVP